MFKCRDNLLGVLDRALSGWRNRVAGRTGSVCVAAKFIATLDAALRRRGQESDDQAQYRQVEQHLHGHQQLIPFVCATTSPKPTVAKTVTVKYSAVEIQRRRNTAPSKYGAVVWSRYEAIADLATTHTENTTLMTAADGAGSLSKPGA